MNKKKWLIYLFCILLFAFSPQVLPADENENNPQSNLEDTISSDSEESEKKEAVVTRTVNMTAGPNGKVTWFIGKNLGIAQGNAVVKYQDVTLKADHIWVDMDKEVVEAEGNVYLDTKGQSITARKMLFDLKSKKGIMIDGISYDNPWYNSGEEMTRLNAQDSYIEHGAITSCSLTHPHYSFEASQIVIHLKKEIIAKHVVLKIGGVPLLYLPVYRRSLEEDKPARYIFRIGSNSFEGYYVKNALPIRWKMINGSIFLDYTTRRGTSEGIEFDYNADKVKIREIFIPVPKDAPYEEWREAREKIEEIQKRAKGELDKIWLKQIFIKYQIEEADKIKAEAKAKEALEKVKEENADFAQQARRWSEDKATKSYGGLLGYFLKDENGIINKKEGNKLTPVESEMIPVIETALNLQPGKMSDILETEQGYYIIKNDSKEGDKTDQGLPIRWIILEFEPSEKAQEEAQKKADEILTNLSAGAQFEEIAKLHSDDKKTKEIGGDIGWKTFQELDISFHSAVRVLSKGELSRTIITPKGLYILKLEDKEKTPDFGDIAREQSKGPDAETGGDMGFKSRWEIPKEVRREAFRLELNGISNPIRSEDGYRIVKVEKKRNLGGDVYIKYGDLYSYQIEKNPVKMGQTYNVNIHHNQTLWRSDEEPEDETMTGRIGTRAQKNLGMRAELSLAGRQYKDVYTSYTPERELRSYCAFDYYYTTKTGSSGSSRLIVDGTRDLLGADTQLLQKYPEFGFRSPNYRLNEVQPFKKVNSGLIYISDRVQGKATFSEMAEEFSDDIATKEKGGDMGWLYRQESGLGSKIESEIFDPNKLKPDDISEPISTSDGYHIVKIDDIEAVRGRRERVKVSHIFIAIDPNIRTKDEASRLADTIYRKLVEGNRPSLGFLTLNNSSFSYDTNIGNYFKDSYRDEENIWLQTADASASLRKRAIIKLGISRELNLNVDGTFRQIWHSRTQPLRNSLDYGEELDPNKDPNMRDMNVLTNTWNSSASLSIDLHRIYYPSFVPKVYAMRHNISPYARFSYRPPSESETRAKEQQPKLYPFGPATWTYEQKLLTVGMVNGLDIKTKVKRERISLFRWDISAGADLTEEKGSERRYNRVYNTFTITPSRDITLNNKLEFDPNYLGTGDPFLVTLSNDLRYSDPNRRWSSYISSNRIYYRYYKEWRQFFRGNINLRWSRDWRLDFDLEYEYDDRAKDINSLRISFMRNLHCWESQIAFRRSGVKGGYITKDFYFQIDIVADPGKSLGVGYDTTGTWSLRSLPGMGRVGGFLRQGYSTYY